MKSNLVEPFTKMRKIQYKLAKMIEADCGVILQSAFLVRMIVYITRVFDNKNDPN